MSTRISPTTTPKMARMIGICARGERLPIHWNRLFSENPRDTGRASGLGDWVIRKMKAATTAISAIAMMTMVDWCDGALRRVTFTDCVSDIDYLSSTTLDSMDDGLGGERGEGLRRSGSPHLLD